MVLLGSNLLLGIVDLRQGLLEEEGLLASSDGSSPFELSVDESVQVSLELLVLEQFLGRVLLGTEVEDLKSPERSEGTA
jgi:hypothetical protein